MKDFDLPIELRKFREKNGMTEPEMALKMMISERDYERLENGNLKPGPADAKRYRNFLYLEMHGPLPARKWYRRREWHWLIPVVILLIIFSLESVSESFAAGYAAGDPNRTLSKNPPKKLMTLLSVVVCLTYWGVTRPPLPFKTKAKFKFKKLFR